MAYKSKARARENEKKWRAANPDKMKAISKRSHDKYRAQHLEECRAARRKYYWEHRDQELARAEQYRREHPDRIAKIRRRRTKAMAHYLRLRQYGLSQTTYDELLAKQNGVCAICRLANPNGRALSVDHDHGTDVVRGLLCLHCNSGLGQFRDDSELLRRALAYMELSRFAELEKVS